MRAKNNGGFTLIELGVLTIFVLVVVVWAVGGCLIVKGNYWFTEEGVLRELRVDHPNATRILKIQRNAYKFSEVVVENKDGSRSRFYLDTNVLFNYRFLS